MNILTRNQGLTTKQQDDLTYNLYVYGLSVALWGTVMWLAGPMTLLGGISILCVTLNLLNWTLANNAVRRYP